MNLNNIFFPITSELLLKKGKTNKGKETLVLIEVQSGSYLGEDDIIRFEDNYGRI